MINKTSDRNVLISTLIVVIPTLIFFAISNVAMMASYFKLVFTLIFLYYFLFKKNASYLTAIGLSSFPLVFFLKGELYFYFITTALLLLIHFKWFINNNKEVKHLFTGVSFLFFFVFFLFNFLLSFILTGSYKSSLKSVDLVLAAGLVPLLYNYKRIFVNTILIFGLVGVVMAFIVGSTGARFLGAGSEVFEGLLISGANPITYGISVSLFLTFLILAPNETLPSNVSNRKYLMISLTIITVVALFLTTSRGSILAFLIVFIAVSIFNRSVLKTFRISFLIAGSIVMFYVITEFVPEFSLASDFIVGRAKDKNIDMNQYSHNRLLMWEMVIQSLKNGEFILYGIGPGNQVNAFSKISLEQGTFNRFNMNYIFHALPLQFIIELGLVVTIFFYYFFFKLVNKSLNSLRKSRFTLPIIGSLFWFGITLSVTGVDMLSGVALGFAFIQKNTQI